MKKRVLAFLVMVVLTGLAFVPAAVAGPPVAVSGTWEIDGELSEWIFEKAAGGNTFFSGTEYTGTSSGWTGDFVGTSIDYFTATSHKNGVANAKFVLIFSGKVLGVEGTMVLDMVLVYTTTGRADVAWVIKSGTGGLEGLQGEGKMVIDWNPMASYSGKVHWKK